MLHVQQLSKTFGKIQVLSQLNIYVERGQAVAIIGPNGSGKTTLIKSILGMVVPEEGTILFDGKPVGLDAQYRRFIGYMPQIGRYPDNMQVGQLFDMMRDLRQAAPEGLDEELIHAYRLPDIYHKTMRTLSGGTRQKVSAALAFLFDAPVMILDEPTAGLDPLSAEILKEKVGREKQQNKLFLITSHIMSDLEELATDVLYLVEGKVVFLKSMQALRTETGEERLGKAIAKIMEQQRH
ncbi:MAG: ABC transporter ATP-binding protein [Saprospirales bacterium]|jgi:Cu-processing system ATP-binding protein|nr:ABC transporter ATP-binding protein [Saprospirales bacterium]MBK8921180.1 ABC transporter ATP-binding protein [Saprospirales bacterium]